MRTVYYPDSAALDNGFAATIGFFDGVHCGHRFLIDRLKSEAQRRGLRPMVITFDSHPRHVVQPNWEPRLLTTIDEKCLLLSNTGIDTLVVLRFDEAMARLSAPQFMDEVLRRHLGVQMLLTGYDNRFGHNRDEGLADYQRYGRQMGIDVLACEPYTPEGTPISSSHIRRLLDGGCLDEANSCLGYLYTISGSVVQGEQRGRTLGFPTANILPACQQKLVPGQGVYAVEASIDGGAPRPAITNIGTCPTFGRRKPTIETHLIDETDNLYGHSLTIALVQRIRDEKTFNSPQQLAQQIACDKNVAMTILNTRQKKNEEKP